MIEIKDLLARFDHILLSEEAKINAIRKILEKVVNLKIEKIDIKIKNNTVYLNVKPIYKSEIFLQQEKIMSLLQETLGKKSPKNIR
ncbi:MAG TPA: hypothetical protein VGO63_02730 [Candidatus Paceibacterota bacterium]|jgi:hypothetical protein|nr:hypothetical protein [Candidatus Paceibacterota bacterium]